MRDVRSPLFAAALALATVVVAVGCGDDDDEAEEEATKAPALNATGPLQGSNAFVGVSTDGRGVIAYVCDGEAKIAERFQGTLSGNSADLRSAQGAQLSVSVSEEEATGTFTSAAGEARDFTAGEAGGSSGIYFADIRGRRAWAGWVLGPDGDQRGAIQQTGTVSVAPQLDPTAGTISVAGQSPPVIQIKTSQFSVRWPD